MERRTQRGTEDTPRQTHPRYPRSLRSELNQNRFYQLPRIVFPNQPVRTSATMRKWFLEVLLLSQNTLDLHSSSLVNKFQSEQRCVHRIFFPEMGQMIVEMGMIRGPLESLESIFTWFLIFPDHLELILNVGREYVTEWRTNRPTDGRANGGRTNGQARVLERLESGFTRFSIFPDNLECISDVLEERITDGRTNRRTDQRTDGWTDGRTKPLIEMRGRI